MKAAAKRRQATACTGLFVSENRLPACRRCPKCRAHLAYIYDGAPKPLYVPPSQCSRKSALDEYAKAKSSRAKRIPADMSQTKNQ